MPLNSLGRSIFNNNDIYLNLPDSKFKVDIPVKSSFMMGRLIPIGYPIEVLKNDKFTIELAGLVRTGTAMIAPVLDDMYMDVFCFWVPKRVIWNRMAQFLGENDATAWTQAVELEEPTFDYYGQNWPFAMSSVSVGNYLLDAHFGLPYAIKLSSQGNPEPIKIRALEHRGYYEIWNRFFRFTEWQRPVLYSKGDNGSAGEFGYTLDSFELKALGGGSGTTISAGTSGNYQRPYLMPVNRFYDSFVSIKPQPAFGDNVDIFGDAVQPVIAGSDHSVPSSTYIKWINSDTGVAQSSKFLATDANGLGIAAAGTVGTNNGGTVPANLWADVALDVTKLRSAVLLQNFKQAIGRTDARVDSILQLLFGPGRSGFEDDKPKLLNHYRQRIGVNQIVATADSANTTASSHLGETGAYSLTALSCDLTSYRFNEPGFIYTLACVRQVNTYGQGIPEQFLRYKFWDQYNPFVDKIGMVPFKAIYINAESAQDLVLGYQEAHYSYKATRGITVGALNPAISDSFNFWTLGTVWPAFTAQAGIGPGSFIQGPQEVDRALLADHNVSPQFIADFRIHGYSSRKMSVHGDSLVLGMRL